MINSNPHFPANILLDEVSRLFESMLEKYDIQQAFNKGLSPKLFLISTDTPLRDFAEVKVRYDEETNNKILNITVYDNYCQYLWSLAYSIFLFFNETTIKQLGNIPESDEDKDKAIENFENAIGLIKNKPTSRSVFFSQPNPVYNPDKECVQIANNIFKYALVFILLHEFAHIELGHLEKAIEEIEDEVNADYHAFYNLKLYESENKRLVAFGCITAVASLLFRNKGLSGGNTHPDPDLRLKKLLSDLENTLVEVADCAFSYSFATVWFKLWAVYYGKYDLIENVNLESCQTAKDYFLAILEELDKYKKTINNIEISERE